MVETGQKIEAFTWRCYEKYLDTALSSGYRFIGFDGLTETSRLPEYPFVLLRHDIDYDPRHASPLAELEARRRIRATYFLQVDSRFYDVKHREVAAIVNDILTQGHWLGLHFDANNIPDDQIVVTRVDEVAHELELCFGAHVAAVSFHMPTYRHIGHLCLENGRVNTYAPLFVREIDYASDSNQDFRGKDVLALLRQRTIRRLQLLIHPIWWRQSYTPLRAKMEELAASLGMVMDDILTAEQRTAIERA